MNIAERAQPAKLAQLAKSIERVRAERPLIHHITNYVTVNDCANITLALGASPIMADALEEAADIAALSSALVLNIGTLNERTIPSMIAAGVRANERGIPVLFDPVGAGASAFRSRTTERILREIRCDVVRGNMSEIRFIFGENAQGKGVDAADGDMLRDAESARTLVAETARRYGCTVAVTGACDIVSDGTHIALLENGHAAMRDVSGTGCMCNSLVASFLGAGVAPFHAAICGVSVMSLAGEIAHERVSRLGTGSLRVAMIDEVGNMSPEIFERRVKISCKNI